MMLIWSSGPEVNIGVESFLGRGSDEYYEIKRML